MGEPPARPRWQPMPCSILHYSIHQKYVFLYPRAVSCFQTLLRGRQSKKKEAEDALWADEANNKNAQKKAEEDRKRAVEAEKVCVHPLALERHLMCRLRLPRQLSVAFWPSGWFDSSLVLEDTGFARMITSILPAPWHARYISINQRALLKALEAKEAAELEKKRPPPKVTAATVYKIRSLVWHPHIASGLGLEFLCLPYS